MNLINKTVNIALFSFFHFIFSIVLIGCLGKRIDNGNNFIRIDSTASLQINNSNINVALEEIYTQAIDDYIQQVNKEYHLTFDTLYFGKHVFGQPDDFPDIELPNVIENTIIRMISPEQGIIIQKQCKTKFYINLMSWVNSEMAEFNFVGFSNGMVHQFDANLVYQFNYSINAYEIESTKFSNYLYKAIDK